MKSLVPQATRADEPSIFAFIDSQVEQQVDLSFLPSGTCFVSSIPAPHDLPSPRRLVMATGNIQDVFETAKSWLEDEQSSIEILWNPRVSPDFGHALTSISRRAPYSSFRKTNSTARLLISSNLRCANSVAPAPLTPQIATLLEETANENISVPPSAYKQLIWRHSYLLNQIERLSNKIEALNRQLTQSPAARAAAAQAKVDKARIEELTAESQNLRSQVSASQSQISELQTSLYSLQRRYDSLSKSRLGSLTLKYWALRRKKH